MSKIDKELAIQELNEYLVNYVDGEFDVQKDYPKTLQALIDGRLTFNEDNQPVYELIFPMFKGTENEKNKLTFKTRVLPSSTASLAKGIDLKTDAVRYSLVVTAHIVGLASFKELDHLSKKDYALVQELSMVFI